MKGLFIVRLYDSEDNEWIDLTPPISELEAGKIYTKKTKDATQNTKFEDGDYYAIFPANSDMFFASSIKYKPL
jgi:hypothetical protein